MLQWFQMKTALLLLLWYIAHIARAGNTDEDDFREYCQFESFNATCPLGSQILIRQAVYGRMRVGRCVKGDYGFIGCKTNVQRYLDQQCSGRSECQISVPQLEEMAQPCPEDFKSYLEASYECIQVAMGTSEECHVNRTISLDETSGYLSTLVTDDTGFGSANCPWTVTVDAGQRVELVYYNLRQVNEDASDDVMGCPLFAVIRENGAKSRDFNLCEMVNREGHLFTSESNQIQFYFISPMAQREIPKYIVHFRGTGCSDIRAPSHTWVRREGDNAVVRCNHTQETWYVTCKGSKWLGDIGNCTKAQRYRTGYSVSSSSHLPHGILMAVVIGILLGVVIGTVLLAVVFTCRRRRFLGEPKPDSLLQRPPGSDVNGTVGRGNPYPKLGVRQNPKTVDGTGTDYQFRQQTRPLIPRPDSGSYSRPLGPPPYTINWPCPELPRNGQPYETRGPSQHDYEITLIPDHEYESPTVSHDGKLDSDSLAPPVYFELDSKRNSSNHSEPGYQRRASALDDGNAAHLSV